MTLDLIFSAVLLVFSVYCFFYIGGADNGTPTELGAAAWPRVILTLMIILLIGATIGTWIASGPSCTASSLSG